MTSGDGEPFTPTEGQLYAAALPKGHRRLELINRGTCAQIALDCARATRSRKVFVTTKHLVNSPMPRRSVNPPMAADAPNRMVYFAQAPPFVPVRKYTGPLAL